MEADGPGVDVHRPRKRLCGSSLPEARTDQRRVNEPVVLALLGTLGLNCTLFSSSYTTCHRYYIIECRYDLSCSQPERQSVGLGQTKLCLLISLVLGVAIAFFFVSGYIILLSPRCSGCVMGNLPLSLVSEWHPPSWTKLQWKKVLKPQKGEAEEVSP